MVAPYECMGFELRPSICSKCPGDKGDDKHAKSLAPSRRNHKVRQVLVSEILGKKMIWD